jgi:DNA-binding LacI/PurR family transcriptional regulator
MNFPNWDGVTQQTTAEGPKKFEDLHRAITMAQIAKAASVSQGAISSMLNDRNYGIRVSEKTRTHVFKICREMGYIPNDLRALVRMYPELGGFSLLIANNLPGGLTSPMISRIASATILALPTPDQALSIAFYDPAIDYLAEGTNAPGSVSTFVDSKFLVVGQPNLSLLELLTRRGLPVMLLGSDVALPGVVSFLPDYALASKLAISHLNKLGHTNIGIVSGPFGSSDPKILDFNRGVRLACDELGLKIDAQHIVYSDLTVEAGRVALDEILARNPQPSAVFCMSDAVALGLMERAQTQGVSVPENLSVIGCGDDFEAQMIHPQLTTIRLPFEEMSRQAVAEVDRIVHNTTPLLARKIFVPLSLVERASVAAPKSN